MAKATKKAPPKKATPKKAAKKRASKYDEKLKVNGTFDELMTELFKPKNIDNSSNRKK